MRQRCMNPNAQAWPRYGGRGIKVCERWDAFEAFLADMGERPSPNHSLDRIDNDGDYCPENCRWTDRKTQQNNTRGNRYIELDGERLTLSQWEERMGLTRDVIRQRLLLGWSEERAVRTPVRRYGT